MTVGLVIVGALDRRSGGYSYDVDLVAHLESLGHRVELWSLPPDREEAARTLNALFDSSPSSTLVLDALVHDLVLETLEARRSLDERRWVALVHHLAWLEDPVPSPATEAKKDRERRFLRLVDAMIFNSDDTRATVVALRGPSAPFRPSVICRPPLPPASLQARTRGDQGECPRLLFLGNLVPRKNLHGLLEALGRVFRQRPELEWRLTVAGSPHLDPGYAEECRQQAESAGWGARVDWKGRVSDDEREELWARADLLALPSFHEGWGMAHAEALAHGIPSLAVPRGGVLEVLGDAALWSEPDPGSLGTALQEYLTSLPLRERLRTRARHRAPVWADNTGFAGLGPFLEGLKGEEPTGGEHEFSWGSYLEAKASIDTRSLHPRVREAAFSRSLPATVVELGGGTGTMARRLRQAGQLDAETRYLLVDQDPDLLERAVQHTAMLFEPGRFRTHQADLRQYWDEFPDEAGGHGPDLVIAHALLDLFDPRAAAPALARMGARRYWLTHLFDGVTTWEPVLDPALDDALSRAYHQSMADRAPGGACGSPRSGRDWLQALPRAGLQVVDAAASDWLVRPGTEGYSAADTVFLRSMLHFFRSSLTGRSDVDQAGLAWWLATREAQVSRGEATLIVHQLDLVAEPGPGATG